MSLFIVTWCQLALSLSPVISYLETRCIFDSEQSFMIRFNTDGNCDVFTHSQTLRVVFLTLSFLPEVYWSGFCIWKFSVCSGSASKWPKAWKASKQMNKNNQGTKRMRHWFAFEFLIWGFRKLDNNLGLTKGWFHSVFRTIKVTLTAGLTWLETAVRC